MKGHIKICGLRDAHMADVAISAGADLIGLVFFPNSPRHITLEQAAEVALAAKGKAGIVALMVNPDNQLLQKITTSIPITHLQLHGRETPERVNFIRTQFNLPVLKALGVATKTDVAKADAYTDIADIILFDAKPPNTAQRPGGLGQAFDWSCLQDVNGKLPWLLSGGLNLNNIADAVKAAGVLPGFSGVDTSSGVESHQGVKDTGLIKAFVEQAQAAMAATQAFQQE